MPSPNLKPKTGFDKEQCGTLCDYYAGYHRGCSDDGGFNFDVHFFIGITPRSAANLERSGKFVRQQRLVYARHGRDLMG